MIREMGKLKAKLEEEKEGASKQAHKHGDHVGRVGIPVELQCRTDTMIAVYRHRNGL